MQKPKNFFKKARLLQIVFLAMFLLIAPAFNPISSVNASSPTPLIELEHSIQVTRGGLIIVNDSISLRNGGVEPITSFTIGFNKDLAKNLDNATAYTTLGEQITIMEGSVDSENGIYWMILKLPQALGQDESLDFLAAFAFSRLITYNDSDPVVYTALFPKYPALPTEASSCMVEINLPNGTTFVESSLGNSTTHLESPLEGISNQTGSVSFEGPLQYVECTFVRRDVVIDSWGNIISHDKYGFRNIGRDELAGLDFPLPEGAGEVTAYDAYGPLVTSVTELNGKKYAAVVCRYPLRGEVNSVQFHDSYAVTIKYQLKKGEHSTQQTTSSSNQIEIEAFPRPDWTIKSLETKMTFPEGADNVQASPLSTGTSQNLFTQSAVYYMTNGTCINNYNIKISYDYNMFWSAFRPTLWIGMATVAVGGIAFLRKGKKPKPTPIPSKDTQLIGGIIGACSDRMGYWVELEDLEKDFDNRRIRRKAYNRRRRIFVQRLSSLNKEITNYEGRVSSLGENYAELMKRLEEAENEVRTLHSEVDRLKNQLRRGRLSQNAYSKLREACDERIRRAKAVIEEVIAELRGLVD